VTVTLTNDNSGGFILADGVMLIYIADSPSMPPPPGNSESVAGSETSSQTAAPSSGGTLRSEPSQASATDQALLNTAYWDELESVAAELANDAGRWDSENLSGELATPEQADTGGPEMLDLALGGWLD